MRVPPDATKRAEPESFRARSLAVSLTAKDIHTSLAWYCDVLGFTIDQKHEREGTLRAVSLKAGSVRILLGQDDGAKGWDRVKGEGFSFQLTTVQNIDALAALIKSRGGKLDSEPMDTPWGQRVFRLADPDGFKVVISSPKG
jgi:uncharacterized glyoxalase superfamily protein PhnB